LAVSYKNGASACDFCQALFTSTIRVRALRRRMTELPRHQQWYRRLRSLPARFLENALLWTLRRTVWQARHVLFLLPGLPGGGGWQ